MVRPAMPTEYVSMAQMLEMRTATADSGHNPTLDYPSEMSLLGERTRGAWEP